MYGNLSVILLLLTIVNQSFASTYYIDCNAVNDNRDGSSQSLAWKTIAKASTTSFAPGDVVLFKRGCNWKEGRGLWITSSGASGHPITFDAYGTGAKPLLDGSINITHNTWTQDSANLWKTTINAGNKDIGNLIFNNETSVGWKRNNARTECINQGDFYSSKSDNTLYLYSISNPSTYYNKIDAVADNDGINAVSGQNHLIIRNFAIQHFGGHGINIQPITGLSSDIVIEENLIRWIGGSIGGISTNPRYGNGVQLALRISNIIVRNNVIDQIYDVGLDIESWISDVSFHDVEWYGNKVSRASGGADITIHTNGTASNIAFHDNIFFDSGWSWAKEQRPDPYGFTFMLWNNGGTIRGCEFSNNISYKPSRWHVGSNYSMKDGGGCMFHSNVYWPDATSYFSPNYVTWNFTHWKQTSGQDKNSMIFDPFESNSMPLPLSIVGPK